MAEYCTTNQISNTVVSNRTNQSFATIPISAGNWHSHFHTCINYIKWLYLICRLPNSVTTSLNGAKKALIEIWRDKLKGILFWQIGRIFFNAEWKVLHSSHTPPNDQDCTQQWITVKIRTARSTFVPRWLVSKMPNFPNSKTRQDAPTQTAISVTLQRQCLIGCIWRVELRA